MTKPDQQDMNQEQLEQCISTLTDVASEIRSENHAGWGNAIDDVIESLKGRRLVQAGEDDDDSILCKCGIYITKGDEACYNCEMLANASPTEPLQPASVDEVVLDTDQCIELAEALIWGFVKAQFAEVTEIFSRFEEGHFKAGIESALEEMSIRLTPEEFAKVVNRISPPPSEKVK